MNVTRMDIILREKEGEGVRETDRREREEIERL